MASKTIATPQPEDVPKMEGHETPPDSPLLDLSDAAVKKLIRSAKKRGYVTHDQINSLLSSEEVKSEQIEDILAMFSEMGVNVVETEEAEPEDEGGDEEARGGARERARRTGRDPAQRLPAKSRPRSPPSAPTTPFACICAKWARWICSRARARSPSPSASRPAARP